MKKFKTKVKKKSSFSLDDAYNLLNKGILDLVNSEDWKEEWKEYLKVQARFHTYSFKNAMLILKQCPHATQVASFKTWKDLGRKIITGPGSSIRILAPSTRKVKEIDDITGEEKENNRVVGFVPVPVFDISQTEGKPLPNPSFVKQLEGHTDLYERIISICPYQVHEKDDCDVNGYYHFEDDDITILGTNSTTQKLKTLIHEWSHAKLHNLEALKERKVNSALMEVEVESIAFIVCHKLGVDTSQYSFGYIAGWGSGEEALKKIEESGMYIQQCAKEILDTIIPVLQNSEDPSTMEVNR